MPGSQPGPGTSLTNTLEIMKTIEGNKLIAGYVGDKTEFENEYSIPIKGDHALLYWDAELQFHNSWDWLMPVVEKINDTAIDEDSKYTVVIMDHRVWVKIEGPQEKTIVDFDGYNTSFIESVWNAVVEFIEWYNTQK
jgi:hypothetical protein